MSSPLRAYYPVTIRAARQALARRGVLPSWLRHYNVKLVDSLYVVLQKLGFAADVLPGWKVDSEVRSQVNSWFISRVRCIILLGRRFFSKGVCTPTSKANRMH